MSDAGDATRTLRFAAIAFAEDGFEGMSMRTLADKCGVSTTWLYYHFGSKEALFQEACSLALEETFEAVQQRLKATATAVRSPDLVIGAFFDEWVVNKTTLLLVQRDVISAWLTPDRWLTSPQYRQTLRLMSQLYQNYFGKAPDEDFSFALAAFMYGFCSLMLIDQRNIDLDAMPASEREQYIARKRASMMRYCRQLWSGAPTA